MEGEQIGAYRLQRKLGEGGMGAVYLAEHILLGRKAAIKVLLPGMSANQEVVNRFFNEARATTSIADLGIVQVFDFGYHTDGSAFIVMEFLEGENLDARLRRLGRFTPIDALRLVRQVAVSLSAAHARGIVHRDLKPENIFIIGDVAVAGGERPKILDFGIAKLAGDEAGGVKTSTGAIMGTPVFMSPEQCRGAGGIDHRSDIYTLGCILFCMLTGRPPFNGDGIGDIMFGHMGLPAPTPSSLSPGLPIELDHLVLRCLAKSPTDRFQSMQEMADAVSGAERHVQHMQVWTAPTLHVSTGGAIPATTTLRSASGQAAPPATRKTGGLPIGRGVFVIGASVGVVAIVVILAAAFARHAPRESMPVPAGSPPPEVPHPRLGPVDAGVAPPTSDASQVQLPPDAAVPPLDAPLHEATNPATTPQPPSKKNIRPTSTGSNSNRVDRGD